ncbi:phosphate acetyltransferase [Cloacibacterium rupense]|uniref:Phosphate acetyltransferase n=1 Tax=Cloacibacterium rupense TaxID=517423 RepID=A0ABQ2NHN5_9FLAO|nr:phosphate acetyltransferase [Cloacibacterium rupense]GGP01916.1 phosphate acetyltransferase [Cloacibacterium rupense]
MNKAIYITTNEPHSGKSAITLGMMSMLIGKATKVGYFRPIIEDTEDDKIDSHIQTVIDYFKLEIPYDDAYAITKSRLIKEKNNGNIDSVIDLIIEKYKKLEDQFDFVLVEGTSFSGEGTAIELDINVLIAKNLGIPVTIVGSGENKTHEELIDTLSLTYNTFNDKDVDVLAIIANKVNADDREIIKVKLKNNFPETTLTYDIPVVKSLDSPTFKEIVKELDGKLLFGEKNINNQVESFSVGAMQLRNYLQHITEKGLVITPGDRADIILGALQANQSINYPSISGIILTGGIIPEDTIMKLIEGLSDIVPIASVEDGTYLIANKIGAIKSKIYADNIKKIETSIQVFQKHVNLEELSEKLVTFEVDGITPRMFQYNLLKQARKQRKHIVLPEGNDDRILVAIARLQEMDVVDLTVIGSRKEIEKRAAELKINLDYSKLNIVLPNESLDYENYSETYYELRKEKNVTLAMAQDLMEDVSYYGTMMVYKGHADGMVSGAAHTTQHTILPALQFVKTKPDCKIVSSVFFMCLENRVSVFGDCAINPNPTAEQLAEIAISSAESSIAFGIEPKIAMLSYSSGTSGKGDDVDKVRNATEIVRLKRPDLKIEGPIQYDAAVDMTVGKSKLPNSEVAGQASVLIFPDLNTGNNTYKAVQRETGALAIGPMLQGLNKPVNDLSRGCTIDDIINTVIITAIQAQSI